MPHSATADANLPPAPAAGTILLYLPVAFHQADDGSWLLEDQACNGLRLWARHFEKLIVIAPLRPGLPPPAWVGLSRIGPALERIEIVPLPWAWRPDQFLRRLPRVRRQIRALIPRADWLGFAIGGLFGDWGAVAAYEARRQGRMHYIWADRVESAVTRERAKSAGKWRHRLLARLYHRPMAAMERDLVRHASLGLFHGRDTWSHYAPLSPNPQLVHDIHINREDHLPPAALKRKITEAGSGPLRIIYTGRAEPMKGAMDWVEALVLLAEQGVDFRATWAGEGSALPQMQARISAAGLSDKIALPGFITGRETILALLREADVMAFCHKTPESPRCLIEALISGTPIIGYDSAYPRDLIAGNGGGLLVPGQSPAALAAALAGLARDRARLGALIAHAAGDGAPFSDDAVFAHRAGLILTYLPRFGRTGQSPG